ncbi:MAG: hypothetical protein CSA29_02580 [Desulfobacterales bacterium]|nr:MAG: hypothetical protein CSA29_02580 [Desulfobacterales bacterium]
MRKLIVFMLTIVLFGCSAYKNEHHPLNKEGSMNTFASNAMVIDMFPEAKKDETQHVIALPAIDNEHEYKVEVFVTKTMAVDCNHHLLAGRLLEKTVSGWGYHYYIFQTNGQVMSTMMACPDSGLVSKDVPSQSQLLTYTSKLPIIVYTPKGYQVKYKLWQALPDEQTAIPSTALKKSCITLKFDSRHHLKVNHTRATITIYGYDPAMADVPATVIAQKVVSISELPLKASLDIPHTPETLIVPKISPSSHAQYYVSLQPYGTGAAPLALDTETQMPRLNLDDLTKTQLFYLKLR